MSIRGVITSATVVSASENTPSSMSRSAGPALRAGSGGDPVARPGVGPRRQPEERAGAARAWPRRRGGRDAVSSGATAASSRGSRSPSDPDQPDGEHQPDEPAHRRAGPPGDRGAGGGAGEHEQREMGHMQVAGERAARASCEELAAKRARQVGVRLGGERQPGGPERERGRHQRRDEELEHARSRERLRRTAPAGATSAERVRARPSGWSRPSACSVPCTTRRISSSRSGMPRARASRAATQGQT